MILWRFSLPNYSHRCLQVAHSFALWKMHYRRGSLTLWWTEEYPWWCCPTSPLLCGCYVIECIISDKVLQFVSCGHQVQITICLELRWHTYSFNMHSQPLSIAITEWVDNSNSQSENKQRGKAPSPKRQKSNGRWHSHCASSHWRLGEQGPPVSIHGCRLLMLLRNCSRLSFVSVHTKNISSMYLFQCVGEGFVSARILDSSVPMKMLANWLEC